MNHLEQSHRDAAHVCDSPRLADVRDYHLREAAAYAATEAASEGKPGHAWCRRGLMTVCIRCEMTVRATAHGFRTITNPRARHEFVPNDRPYPLPPCLDGYVGEMTTAAQVMP